MTQTDMKRTLGKELEIPGTVEQRISDTLSLLGASPARETYKRPKRVAVILIAAALTITLLTGTAFAMYFRFGLQDLDAGEWMPSHSETENDNTDSYTLLSLVGLKGTPEYEAAVIWENLLSEWLNEGENLLSPGYIADESDIYFFFNAFSTEAKDRLNDIADEYGLIMPGSRTDVYSLDELYDLLGVSGFMPDTGYMGEYITAGAVYDNGSFSFNGAAALSDGTDVIYHFYRSIKGTFTRIGYLLADMDSFEEWTYTTSDGHNVLLAISANKSLMVADLDNCFIFVNILTGTENSDSERTSYGQQTVDRADLEAFADSFDFTALC